MAGSPVSSNTSPAAPLPLSPSPPDLPGCDLPASRRHVFARPPSISQADTLRPRRPPTPSFN
ncbi:hypothetical protein CO2235_150321 [Cupriavidus oxalaticus]|uniref:Uncharacterized protein n=1 Tax=Cupriavidus oxalaticus TaxID=96344 RepID=A0A375G3Q2_9BURK|nr:hypothetical protein CO2235_150321 [Cupriavidus oxalaticus]